MSAPAPVVHPIRAPLALQTLGAALGLGVIGDLMLRQMPWGIGVTISTAALVAVASGLVYRHRLAVGPDAPWLAFSALLLGVAFVRRDADMLHLLDVVGLIGVLALGSLSLQGEGLRLRGVVEYVRAGVLAAVSAMVGILPLALSDIRWSEVTRDTRLGRARAVALGGLLALPLLIVFAALFASADATFDAMLSRALVFDPETVLSHALLIGVWAALTGGYLRGALIRPIASLPREASATAIGFVPVATMLGLVNLLFLLFVVTQAPYFFGGLAVVERTTGLTLAAFARRGFFELVMVCALVLPILLGAEWTLRGAAPKEMKSFRALAGLLLIQVGAVMGSALFRMKLYVDQFGPSQDRLYATAFMAYLGIVSAWFAWTCLRGMRSRFAFGAMLQGYAVLAALHVVNVDGLIARTNIARATAGAAFDMEYHTKVLGGDAVPALLGSLERLAPADRYGVAQQLLNRWGPAIRQDWRSWNWSAGRARALVRVATAQLTAVPCVPRPGTKTRGALSCGAPSP